MVKVAIENVFCISIIIPVLSHQGVERLNFVKKTKKYEFLAILSFWNISNTQKTLFEIQRNALPIKQSALQHPRTTYVVSPGGQTRPFWWKMTPNNTVLPIILQVFAWKHIKHPENQTYSLIWKWYKNYRQRNLQQKVCIWV